MALLQEASLIVTANAQKAGKLYSIIPQSGAGDFDVTRATSATRVDSQGLIEIPRTNLLTFSEQVDNVIWIKTNVNVTQNAGIAPDGTNTADLVVPNTTAGEHNVSNSSAPLSPVTNFETYSIYAKSSGYTFLGIRINVSSTWVVSFFNLSNGTVVSSGANFSNTRIEDVGNGWYRCSVTYQNRTANGLQTIPSNNGSSVTFSGNNVDGVLLWGAQLETSVSPTTYIPTTSVVRTRFQGITQDGLTASNIPRLDYTNASCPSILVEPQRTNSIRNSTMQGAVVGTPGTLPTNWAISLGLTQTIVSQGVENGLNYIDYKLSGTASTTNSQLAFEGTSIISASIGQVWSASVYLKIISSTLPPNSYVIRLREATATGTFVAEGQLNISPTTSFQRFSYIRTNTGATTERIQPQILFTTTVGQAYDFTVRVYAPQLEQGSNPTSYIPTLSTSMTRNADVIDNTNMSTLIGQTEGAMFVDINYERFNPLADSLIATISNGTISNSLNFAVLTNGFFATTLRTAGSIALQITINAAIFTLGRKKIVISYKSGETNLYVNGVKIGSTNTSAFTFPVTINKFNLGSSWSGGGLANNTINSAALWKTVLTDSQAIQLTTP
jgi:hypothetical protein